MHRVLQRLHHGLIVSCQPVPDGPLDRPEIVAAFAAAAIDGGAVGVRIEGIRNLRAVRPEVGAPIIGLVKRILPGLGQRITPFLEDAEAIAGEGAEIVAFDATTRDRTAEVGELIARIHAAGALAMADCASAEDGARAVAAGADVVGSTLSGYTGGPVPTDPDLGLVAALAKTGSFTIAEGRYHRPEQAAEALRAGASAVVVGSAITRPEHITGWFVAAMTGAREPAR